VLSFIVIGIIQGAVIGLVALGIVLVYKGSRVFNFAQAEFGSVAAFLLYILFDRWNVPYLPAVVLTLGGIALVGYLMERLVVRPLFDAPRVTLLVATAGITLMFIALMFKVGEVLTEGGAPIFSMDPAVSGDGFAVFGRIVRPQEILTLLVVAGLGVGLTYFFNKTDLGLAILATSQESVATELVGISTKRVSSLVWTMAALLGGIAGILQAPASVFTPGFMTVNFLLAGFTAAVVGGITSLTGAFVGGQIIGITSNLASYVEFKYVKAQFDFPGFSSLVVFIVLLAILMVRPSGLMGKEA